MRVLIAVAILTSQFAYNAQAQQPSDCAPVDIVSAALAKHYGEHPLFIGAGGKEGQVALTVFLNPKTGTFTLVGIKPDGMACEILDGEHWRALKEPVDEGNPS